MNYLKRPYEPNLRSMYKQTATLSEWLEKIEDEKKVNKLIDEWRIANTLKGKND
jgi:hypothetical protein